LRWCTEAVEEDLLSISPNLSFPSIGDSILKYNLIPRWSCLFFNFNHQSFWLQFFKLESAVLTFVFRKYASNRFKSYYWPSEMPFRSWLSFCNTIQIVPSALWILSNSFVNLEFYSLLLRELPSAILTFF